MGKSVKLKLTVLLVLVACFSLGYILRGYTLQQGLIDSKKTAKSDSAALTTIQNEVMASFGKNEVVIKSDQVIINEGWDSPNPLQVRITQIDYPNLFLPADPYNRIHIQEISASENSDIKLLYLSRQRPDHGGIADGYFVTVDPVIGKVVSSGWNRLFGTVRLNSSSNGSAIPLAEFTQYDRSKQKYVLVNNQHIKDFERIKTELNDLNKKETCRLNGKSMTILEALSSGSDTDKCGDQMFGSDIDEPADAFITLGQYKEILSNIDKIISGENIKVFDRI